MLTERLLDTSYREVQFLGGSGTAPRQQVGRSREMSLRRCRTRGIALVAVLWVVSLLAAIAASFATTVRSETVVARNQIQNAEARALADAGFYRTVMALALDREGMSLSGLPEAWSFSGGKVTTSVQAEGGKVDLNAADAALLAGLFAAAGAIDPGALAVGQRLPVLPMHVGKH